MNTIFTKLKKVPAITRQELLLFAAGSENIVSLKITTKSGSCHNGFALSIGDTKEEGAILLLQLAGERNELTNTVLHIPVVNIESIELPDENDVLRILSLGEICVNPDYEISGKLEVQREFKNFADAIHTTCGINTGVPQMDVLPADGLSLNRICRLTGIIQQSIIEVLNEADANNSWKARYTSIVFLDADSFDVQSSKAALIISFAFSDIHSPEISQKELIGKLLSVL